MEVGTTCNLMRFHLWVSAKKPCETSGGKLYKADLTIWSFQIRMSVLEDN